MVLAIGTEWAAEELAPTHAPELKILGAAIGGTIVSFFFFALLLACDMEDEASWSCVQN